jgi:hypothetical protein
VHADRAPGHAAEDVAATDDDGHLDAQAGDFGDFFHHAHDGGSVDAESVIAHEGLSRQFQQNPFVGWHEATFRKSINKDSTGKCSEEPAFTCRFGA